MGRQRRRSRFNGFNLNNNNVLEIVASLIDSVSDLKSKVNDIENEVVILKKDNKSQQRKIESMDKLLENNSSEVSSIKLTMVTLSNKLDNTSTIADKLLNKLEKIEEEPKIFSRKIKEHFVNALVSTAVSIFIAFIIGMCVYYIKIR